MKLVRSGGHEDDPVSRLRKFRAEHPDVDVMSPLDTQSPFWKAYQGGRRLTVQHNLAAFVGVLESLADHGQL